MYEPDFNSKMLRDLCRRNDISELSLFGSYARGEEREDSDIDLLVRFSKPKSLLSVIAIQRQISEILGRPVDLITEPAISPYLRDRIMKELRMVYNA
ncbi:nucleotidyltransferase family protein [Candidatus Sumerlaeota bacterium]|nr:nucleotidyltransferase family protein [Candidatus Sumerlaeota bacterium]